MMRFYVIRPLAWAIPTAIAASMFGLPISWHLWVFLFVEQALDTFVRCILPVERRS